MSQKLSTLKRPVTRRIPNRNLVVQVAVDGLLLRGFRRRKSKLVTWEQIASLADKSQPIIRSCEEADGRRTLEWMGVILKEAKSKQ